MCDHPGVTPGTASAAIKHPFFGTWTSETTATVMAKRYRLWPCRNRPREGSRKRLAKIETARWGFWPPRKPGRPAPSRRPLRPRLDKPHQHTIGMQLRQLREFLERRRWQKVLVVEEVVSGSRRRPERDRLLDAARRREIDIIPSGTYRFRDQRARLEQFFTPLRLMPQGVPSVVIASLAMVRPRLEASMERRVFPEPPPSIHPSCIRVCSAQRPVQH